MFWNGFGWDDMGEHECDDSNGNILGAKSYDGIDNDTMKRLMSFELGREKTGIIGRVPANSATIAMKF